MNYYFFLNSDNVVEQVVKDNHTEDLTSQYADFKNQRCIKRSDKENLPGKGYIFRDASNDFVKPQPFPSWTLNAETATWEAPVAQPDDDNIYTWDESNRSWQLQANPVLSEADIELLDTVSSLEELEAIKDQLSEDGRAQLGFD